MTFAHDESNADQFYDIIKTFIGSLPSMVDAGANVNWALVPPNIFAVFPATAPGISKAKLDELFEPTIQKLKQYDFPYLYYSQEFPTFLESYSNMNPPSNASDGQIAGRLIPRSLVKENIDALVTTIREIVEAGVTMAGISVNVADSVTSPDLNGVNPY